MHVNYTDFRFNSIGAGYCLHDSTNCLLDFLPMSLYKYFKRVDQYFCLTALSERSFVRLLTYRVTRAASPNCGSKQRGKQRSHKRRVHKNSPRNTRQKLLSLLVVMEIATAKGSWRMHVVAFVMATAVQHFYNKTGPNILVNVISPYHRVDSKGFYYLQLRRHCTCSIYTMILHAGEHMFYD